MDRPVEARPLHGARLRKSGYLFEPFRVHGRGRPLAATSLPDDEELILFERGGEPLALRVREMAYHHAAQGELGGEPYLISF